MPDYAFRFTGLGVYTYQRAARSSVLFELLGNAAPRVKDSNLDMVTMAAESLLKQWRARVYVLKLAGWEPLQPAKSVQYARNCWPGGMFMMPKGEKGSRPCMMPDLCPWCWGRRVIKVCSAMLATAPPMMDEEYQEGKEPPWRVVSYLGEAVCLRGGDRQLIQVLEEMNGKLRDLARYNTRRLYGSFLWTTGCPGLEADGSGDGWRIQGRFLSIVRGLEELTCVPADWRKKDLDGKGWPAWPTTINIQRHVVWAMKYPVPLMRGDPHLTVAYLQAREGMRLAEFRGKFREGLKQKEAAPDGAEGGDADE